nr:hypothetical protein GCM10020063_039650 [Dactylosporangium thailandense]
MRHARLGGLADDRGDGAVTETDLDEFTRTYARPRGWRSTEGLYRSALADCAHIRALAESRPLSVPVLAVDGINAPFTEHTMRQVARDVTAITIPDVGHFVAQEARERSPRRCSTSSAAWTGGAEAGGAGGVLCRRSARQL